MLTTLQRDGETSPRAVAEACSRRTDGVIDRSRCEILRGTQWSAQGRDPVWDSRRGTHLGSGHVWPRQQTEHMIAIASIHTLHSPCKPGAVHIWVPAFSGTSGIYIDSILPEHSLTQPYRHRGEAAEARAAAARRRPIWLIVRKAPEKPVDCDASLEPRQTHAGAHVDAGAERQMPRRISRDVET